MATRRGRATKKATKGRKAKRKPAKRKPAERKPAKRKPAKKRAAPKAKGRKALAKKATKKAPAKKAAKKTSPGVRKSRGKTSRPQSAKTDAPTPESKRKGSKVKQTVRGGTAPAVDDVTRARQILRELRGIVDHASDSDAEAILGDGSLEALLGSVMPSAGKGSPHEHLMAHKRRASLLARLRHGISAKGALPHEGAFVSPTRVQWFWDGLTFVEGAAPFEGVVGLFRDGVVRYGLGVADATKEESLGPLASDFVSIAEAKRSFRGASGKPEEGLAKLAAMKDEDDPGAWTRLLVDHPWILGAQHSAIAHVPHSDPDLPRLTGKRALDAAHDVLIVEAPSTEIVGKSGKVLSSFRTIWGKAERLRTFVQRQAGYLKRELNIKVNDPRFLIVAGRGLSDADRRVVRTDMEAHHAAVRLVTYDALDRLASRTWGFFRSRI